jgi:hypothetical protein
VPVTLRPRRRLFFGRPRGHQNPHKNALKRNGVAGARKCGLKVITGGRKGRQGGPKGHNEVPKTRPGAPRGRLFGTLGSKCAPSQNISIYYVLATFPPPGDSCSAPLAAKVTAMEHSLQKWTQKSCQRCPGGRQGSARGGHLDAKGAKRCPKR